MNNALTTVAVFQTPVEANLAKNRLEEAGMRAFLMNEETASMFQLTNAIGVKLEVGEQDASEALAVLAESHKSDIASPDESGQAPNLTEFEDDEPEPVLTSREENADRAFRAAVLGI